MAGKIGRGQRKKSHARYVTEKRSETNKARKIAKQERYEKKKKEKRRVRMLKQQNRKRILEEV